MRSSARLIWVWALGTILGVGGCAGPSQAGRTPAKREGKLLEQKIETGPAEATAFSPGTPRMPMYTLAWKTGRLDYSQGGRFSGTFRGVSGTFHETGQPVSTFGADEASADRETSVLTLRGNVQVQSSRLDGVLRSDWMRYEADRKRIVAGGNVRFETKDFTLGPFPELWGSPELKRIGTPDVFQEQDANQ